MKQTLPPYKRTIVSTRNTYSNVSRCQPPRTLTLELLPLRMCWPRLIRMVTVAFHWGLPLISQVHVYNIWSRRSKFNGRLLGCTSWQVEEISVLLFDAQLAKWNMKWFGAASFTRALRGRCLFLVGAGWKRGEGCRSGSCVFSVQLARC